MLGRLDGRHPRSLAVGNMHGNLLPIPPPRRAPPRRRPVDRRRLHASGPAPARPLHGGDGDGHAPGPRAGTPAAHRPHRRVERPGRRVAEEELQRSVVGTVGYWTVGRSRPPLVTGRVRLDERGRVFVPLDRRRPSIVPGGVDPTASGPSGPPGRSSASRPGRQRPGRLTDRGLRARSGDSPPRGRITKRLPDGSSGISATTSIRISMPGPTAPPARRAASPRSPA